MCFKSYVLCPINFAWMQVMENQESWALEYVMLLKHACTWIVTSMCTCVFLALNACFIHLFFLIFSCSFLLLDLSRCMQICCNWCAWTGVGFLTALCVSKLVLKDPCIIFFLGIWRKRNCQYIQWRVIMRLSMLLMALGDLELVKVLLKLLQAVEMVSTSFGLDSLPVVSLEFQFCCYCWIKNSLPCISFTFHIF